MDEAALGLTEAQNAVISGIENRLGVACMQLGKYKEAHAYFQRAVELGSAPAAFNLGLCYETGVGIPQDFKLVHNKMHSCCKTLGRAKQCLEVTCVL
jgi:TPR repeat protein